MNLRLWLLFWRLRRMKTKVRSNYLRNKYCRLGFHKLHNDHYTTTISAKRTRTIHYIECQFCQYKFFTTKKQKDQYIEMKKVYHEFLMKVLAKGNASATKSSTSSKS